MNDEFKLCRIVSRSAFAAQLLLLQSDNDRQLQTVLGPLAWLILLDSHTNYNSSESQKISALIWKTTLLVWTSQERHLEPFQSS